MYTSKKTIGILCVVIATVTCGWITGPDDEFQLPPPENLVTMVALFDEINTSNGSSVVKLVLLDINNPSNYKFVSDINYIPLYPKFSPDKKRILFQNLIIGLHDVPDQMALYDIETNSVQELFNNNNIDDPVYGLRQVWHPFDDGFFFTTYYFPFFDAFPVLYFDLKNQNISTVYPLKTPVTQVYPAALLNSNSLIVFSNDSDATNQPEGFYQMDLDGNYISRIDNPHLINRTKNSNLRREASSMDWDSSSQLMVFSEFRPDNNSWKISVTNLDGSFYRNYTNGDLSDRFPVWGPNGETILFERLPHFRVSTDPRNGRVMILDVETGNVKEFVNPHTIGGAVGLRYPDY